MSLSHSSTKTPTEGGIVIIGGGQAGGWAAKTLRDKGYDGVLTVISDEPHDFYERPPLSKAVLLDKDNCVGLSRLFSEDVVESLQINWRRPLRAERILPEQRLVELSNGEQISYSQLLLATGGKPRLPGEEWTSHPHVMTLRSWNDAVKLKQALQQCRRLAIVGGGWIGLEIAASARQLGASVTVFERQSALCMRSVGAEVSQALYELHQQQGVTLFCDCGDIRLTSDENGLPQITSDGSAKQTFDLVVVGIGVELNLELAKQAGLTVASGIVVDECGRTSHPHIYAAGDVAQHPQLGLCIQSWAYAQNQAIVTANSMLDDNASGYDEPAWLWSDQYDANIQILGIPNAVTRCVERLENASRLFIYLNQENQLVQMVAFNDGRAIKLGKRWMASGRKLEPEQLADPEFSLMSLK